jgi:hypothetical protein
MELNELNLTEEQLAFVRKYVQSETDKIRTDYSQKLRTANDELAKYKPAEKSETEKALEQRLKALEDREAQLAAKERSQQIASKIKAKGLPEELVQYLSIGENIDEDVEKVGAALGNYFLNSNYKPESHASNKGITREQFSKMSYMERSKLYKENPELYKMLTQ